MSAMEELGCPPTPILELCGHALPHMEEAKYPQTSTLTTPSHDRSPFGTNPQPHTLV